MLYEYKIRMIDFGDQVGEWSTPFEHTIPSTLPPFVSKGPQTTYIVKENKTLSIPCEVSSTPAATIAWYKDSVAISNTDARFKISTNKIELVNIQSHHDGEYYCKASNTFGVTESDKGKVFVQSENAEYYLYCISN
ncbi:hemolin-like [Hydractinia symbiolongicarpus]|uniref:hemolin-like n=1 Tax=Hydractinia symbiolongicarpus TaxID=13093 RepID=UPI00254BDD92|nr:hemolin-like [Hydractinia symbiolongicarpus]